MKLSFGWRLQRKGNDDRIVDWRPQDAKLRVQMLPVSYLRLESIAVEDIEEFRKSTESEAKHG
jgi:hypothetical protein